MEDRNYRISLALDNYKSYYGGRTTLSLDKPLTVLAGPNGEGKSNLLEGFLIPAADFLKKAQKFRKTSLFHRQVDLSTDPPVSVSYYDLIFHNHLLRSLHLAKSDVGPPQRLNPELAVSEGESRGSLSFKIAREKGGYEKAMAEFEVKYHMGQKTTSDIRTNELDDFDLIYASSDSQLIDFLVHLFSDEIAHQWSKFPGAGQRHRYVSGVLDLFPDEDERLIQDVSDEGFLERFLSDTHRFLRENLATGAKKETLIYLIGLILKRFEATRDNVLLVLLDEMESGINVLRQKMMVESLVHVIESFPTMQEQVRIVLTTHSPVVFSELQARPELADVYYVLREDNAPSRLYRAGGDEHPDEIEKKILLELGLNVFDLPLRVVFVEGETDALFLREVYSECHVTPLHGGDLPRILRELLASIRLAWEKSYTVLVDANRLASIEADIERIHEGHGDAVRIDAASHGFDSIEEFLLGVDLSEAVNASTLWSRIEERVEEINGKLEALDLAPLKYDVPKIRSELEGRKKEGVEDFLRGIKTNERFYRQCGQHWRELLTDSAQEYVSQFRRTHQLSFRE